MYSSEERIRAIKLWLKYDKSLTAVISELGYPSTKMLRTWGKEYLQEQETGVSSRRQRKGKYSDEQKKAAVEHYFAHGRCLSRTMRALGYPCQELLSRWCEERAPARRKQNRSRVQCSNEQKQEAVIALCSRTGSAKDIARAHGVTREALYTWKYALLGKENLLAKAKKKPVEVPKDKDQLLSEIAVLEAQVQRLQLEKDILEAAAAQIKKDPGVDLNDLSNREKTVLIDALKHKHPLKALLDEVGLSRSSYYYQRGAMSLESKYTALTHHIIELFELNNRCYGYRRIHPAFPRNYTKVENKNS